MGIFFLIFVLSFCALDAEPFLLREPQRISVEEVDQLSRCWQACFHSKECRNIFSYKDGEAALQVSFKEAVVHESALWERVAKSIAAERDQSEESGGYFLGPVRSVNPDDNKPSAMTIEQAASFIRDHSVVFYTGAGISLASGVNDMSGLLSLLGMSKSCCVSSEYADYVRTHEQEVLTCFAGFCQKAFTAEPTPAHRAIVTIALSKKVQVMTENFDFLHQRSGIMPFCVSASSVRKQVAPDELKSVDALVCVGMSADDRGLLQWYKDQNPQGKIIAFNLEVPQYVGPDDYVVLGDVQKTLPAILASMKN